VTASSNRIIIIGGSLAPIAGFQFTLNAPSSAGAKVNFVEMQAGID